MSNPKIQEENSQLKTQLSSVVAQRNFLHQSLRNTEIRFCQERNFRIQCEAQRQNYESHITELHYVIAELKRQLDLQHQKTIKEEPQLQEENATFSSQEEEEENDIRNSSETSGSKKSDTGDSVEEKQDTPTKENPTEIENQFMKISIKESPPSPEVLVLLEKEKDENTADMNEEKDSFQKESESPPNQDVVDVEVRATSKEDKSSCRETRKCSCGRTLYGNIDLKFLWTEVSRIKNEHEDIRKNLQSKEQEIQNTKDHLRKIASQRNFLQEKVVELEGMLRCSSKIIQAAQLVKRNENSVDDDSSVLKVAERIQLRKSRVESTESSSDDPLSPNTENNILNNNHIKEEKVGKISLEKFSGSSLISTTSPATQRLIQDLTRPIQQESRIGEIRGIYTNTHQILQQGDINTFNQEIEMKLQEFTLENEKLERKIGTLDAENDVLRLNLEGTKDRCDELNELLPKYESNNMALSLLLKCSDEAIEAYDVLVALLESELGQVLASCRALGFGTPSSTQEKVFVEKGEISSERDSSSGDQWQIEVLHRANENRIIAERGAYHLLLKQKNEEDFEGPYDDHISITNLGECVPWEVNQNLSSSQSLTTTTIQTQPNLWNCSLEVGIRNRIITIKMHREKIRDSIQDLSETWNLQQKDESNDPLNDSLEKRKIDLETALLMQELMASREESAELRSQLFLTQKESGSLHLDVKKREIEILALNTKLRYLTQENKNNLTQIQNNEEENGNNEDIKKEGNKETIEDLITTLDKIRESNAERHEEEKGMMEELIEKNLFLLRRTQMMKTKYEMRINKMEEQMMCLMEKSANQNKQLFDDKIYFVEKNKSNKYKVK